MAWGTPGKTLFGMGAATGSALWFAGMGRCVFSLGQRLSSPALRRWLDVMMWCTALMLGWGLLAV
ncbi:MAG: hypothetical protein PHQ58_21850 [Rhodoferax sp.]|uniref:hypothetical protein n=1 Tax=Rhodoferax sp. TaxID=50421 RepID=UPI002607A6A5|nr:hypothetical protein [Rhodoferax sp.]MDD2883065.1 hypothetical protein [Rhodoferax sp.]